MKPSALAVVAVFALTLSGWSSDSDSKKPRVTGLDEFGYPTNAAAALAKGRSDARRDLTNGVFSLKTCGLPGPSRPEYQRLLEQRCQVRLEPLAGCLKTEGLDKYIDGYNEVACARIEQKFGTNIFDSLQIEAEANYKKSFENISGSRTCQVIAGDTLLKIARQHGVTLKALLQANPNLDSKKLQVGQKILLPAEKRKQTPGHPAGSQAD